MQREYDKGIETVAINFFINNNPQDPPQNSKMQTVLFPIPVETGDLAYAAMVKGLVTYYFSLFKEYTGETIELDPKVIENAENILKIFEEDLKKHKMQNISNLIITDL